MPERRKLLHQNAIKEARLRRIGYVAAVSYIDYKRPRGMT
jgi:hypothetical protein